MGNYEAMFIVNPNANEEQKKEITAQLNEVIIKNQGEVLNSAIWSEKRKLAYPIKKFHEGIYYLVQFKSEPRNILKLKQAYTLNESVIRLLIMRSE